jgi:acylphosphatase
MKSIFVIIFLCLFLLLSCMIARAHLIITGRVQGVWFRANTQKKAIACDLTGWVTNLSDGGVEAIFEGEKENINQIIRWCKKGPSFARVDDVKVHWETPLGKFNSFTIKY